MKHRTNVLITNGGLDERHGYLQETGNGAPHIARLPSGFAAFHTANSLKNLLATSFTILSILIFGIGGLIAWPEAIAMMCGSTIGGYLGGRYAKRVNERYLRIIVILFGLILSIVYLTS